MKRPPPPTVQTNGVPPSQSPRSPSGSSKRLPAFKQPPTPTTNGVNGDTNGLGPRLSNRRKDSVKPTDNQGRPNRGGRGGQDGDRKMVKRMAEPLVKSQSYILKKYRNKPPSLVVHLHPTHWRFDSQDGSFSYNSPMKSLLEHIRAQTIPHVFMEELNAASTRFYEGCLIVQVQDHKSKSGTAPTSTNSAQGNNNVPASIHNYNQYLTPSPYVPYPKKAEMTANKGNPNGSLEHEASASKDKEPSTPNIYHVVLFPTLLSTRQEVVLQANTPDPRQNRKQSTAVPRTPASATVPPTPSSAIPSTPSISGPPAKRQKMSISANEIQLFESKIVQSSATPLFLEPVEDLLDAQNALEQLTDPLHKEAYPAPKVKKRTIAELAADEAIAAQEQDFMLIMDERYASGPTGTKAALADGESGNSTFQPTFEHWQVIRNIKAEHRERAAREAEAKAIREAAAQANRLRQEQQERAAKQEMERRAAQVAQDQIQINNIARQREMQNREMQRQAMVASQHQLTQNHGHPMPNGVSRAQNSSPVVRNHTPDVSSSPLGHVPMNVTSSGQGITSSPARPPSSAQHNQPNGVGMTRQVSRQQAPSRTGTPQMNGTPSMGRATPVVGQNVTSRGPQGSPPISSTPAMNHNVLANQHINGHPPHFSPEHQAQQHQMEQQRKVQQMYAQRQQQYQMQQIAQQRMQSGSPNSQMSPEQRNPATMQNLQQQATMNQHRQASAADYNQKLRMHHANMGNGPAGHPSMPNGMSLPQNHPQQGHPAQRPGPRLNPQQQAAYLRQIQTVTQKYLTEAAHKHGGNPAAIPQAERIALEQRARISVETMMKNQYARAQQDARERQQHVQQQMAAQQIAMMNNGMNGVNGVNGMNGMNGMNGQSVMQGMGGMGVQGMTEQQRHAMMQGMQQMHQMPHLGGSGLQNANGFMHGGQHMNGGGMNGM